MTTEQHINVFLGFWELVLVVFDDFFSEFLKFGRRITFSFEIRFLKLLVSDVPRGGVQVPRAFKLFYPNNT